jgi:hypothetical protein
MDNSAKGGEEGVSLAITGSRAGEAPRAGGVHLERTTFRDVVGRERDVEVIGGSWW